MPDQPGRYPLFNRLSFRLALALGVGAGAVLLVAGSVNIDVQRESLLQLAQTHAERTAVMVRRSTRDAMLANKPADVQGILASLRGQGGIEQIRIFDKDGRIYGSSQPSDVGQPIEQASICVACHERGPSGPDVAAPDSDEAYCLGVAASGREGPFMGVLERIPNEPACATAACHAHPAEHRVLGVLDVQLDMANIESHVARSTKQLGVGLLATIVLVLLLAGIIAWYLVLRPVRIFTEATRRVRRGELATQVPIDTTHEIGQMGRSWNAMISELDRARRELEDWSHTLEDRVREKTGQLETAHEKLIVVEKMASLGKLAAVVAHEINNPLAGITTFAKLLQRRLDVTGEISDKVREEALEALRLVETESARCGRIVRNLLLFSRAPGARFAEHDAGELLDRCILLIRHRAELQEVEVRSTRVPDEPRLECDAQQLQQLLLALSINALEATPDGGVLTLGLHADASSMHLVVSDTGCGIAPEDLPHIFEPFHTSKEEGAGVGLGLAVVYGVVQRHGGNLSVDSEVGRGTQFKITLPLRQPEPDGERDDVPAPAGQEAP